MYWLPDLNAETRRWMLAELEAERREGRLYFSARLTAQGRASFHDLMAEAIQWGNEDSLAESLIDRELWFPSEPYTRAGVTRQRRINMVATARSVGQTEFLSYYVRGFSRRLLEEGVEDCMVYRAALAWEPRDECLYHEGRVYPAREIYDGYRIRYHPPPGRPGVLSIPVGTNCHHAVMRVPPEE